MIQFIQFVYTTLSWYTIFLILCHFSARFSVWLNTARKFSLLILEEFEWNWGKFQWNLRLFYIHKKLFSISRILFLKYNNSEFSLPERCRRVSMIANPHYDRTDFLFCTTTTKTMMKTTMLYLKFLLSFISPVLFLFFISHTANVDHDTIFLFERKTHFRWDFFFTLLVVWCLKIS